MKNYYPKDNSPLLKVNANGSIMIYNKEADRSDFDNRKYMVQTCGKYGITVSDYLNIVFQLNRTKDKS